jgi:hypothetical protein
MKREERAAPVSRGRSWVAAMTSSDCMGAPGWGSQALILLPCRCRGSGAHSGFSSTGVFQKYSLLLVSSPFSSEETPGDTHGSQHSLQFPHALSAPFKV